MSAASPVSSGPQLRVAAVFGARPSAIKMAPLVAALREAPDMQVTVIATGQHRELLTQVLDQTAMQVDVHLRVMRADQRLSDVFARTLKALDGALQRADPALVAVHGDTTSSVAATLAAFYQRRAVVHVEAGMRTGDLSRPFPEEGHRRMTATLASLHLAPSERARDALLGEGVDPARIAVIGNTGLDALHSTLARLDAEALGDLTSLRAFLAADSPRDGQATVAPWAARSPLAEAWHAARAGRRRLVIVTAQRRESFGAGLVAIRDAVLELARRCPEVDFVWPMHPNPHVVAALGDRLAAPSNVLPVAPLDHVRFVALLRDAWCVMTDSGGVQEEAPALGVPLFVLRERTERLEVVEARAGVLVGLETAGIVAAVEPTLRSAAARAQLSRVVHPWGRGDAAARAVEAIRAWRWSAMGPGS